MMPGSSPPGQATAATARVQPFSNLAGAGPAGRNSGRRGRSQCAAWIAAWIAAAALLAALTTPAPAIASAATAGDLRQRLEHADSPPAADARLAAALDTFYRQRDYASAWTDTGRRQALLRALADTAGDGLDPEDYHLTELGRAWSGTGAGEGAGADSELLASRSLLTALAHLLNGKVDPHILNQKWNFQARQVDTEQGLLALSGAIEDGRLDTIFEQARPPHPFYDRLRKGLARLREIEHRGGWPKLGPGQTLKPGMSDPRVAHLRERLRLGGYKIPDADDPALFDPGLEAAVRKFQREQRLSADGAVGAATLAELDVPIGQRIEQMRVNLERARWLLHERSREFLLVDIAGFQATYFVDGEPVWRTRVQVGKAYRKTPEYRSQITHLDFNPTWTVPPTILRNDVLPKVRKDIGYLAAHRMKALDAATGRVLDPAQVDWNAPRGIAIRQDAGPTNSLGRVAIRFANPFSVYLHDTPHSAIFDQDERAVSSGCIRVQRPLELVERLLDDPQEWDRSAVESAIAAGRTRRVHLPRAVTVLLAYWTVEVRNSGRASFRRDIYGRDDAILAQLDRPQPLQQP